MPDLLFEIGTEELPPSLIEGFVSQLKENIIKGLEENFIVCKKENTQTFSTPRRIAVLITDIPNIQPEKTLEIKGPPRNKAFDENGNPTQVAIGFTKKANITTDKLITKNINGADYLFASTKVGGKSTKELLPEILVSSLKQITGDKFMTWGSKSEKFARPIRWIVAILDKEIIDFTYANIKSSNISYGHRFLSEQEIKIEQPIEYKNILKENYVLVDSNERKSLIESLAYKLANKINGKPLIENKLLQEVTNITEYPGALLCNFDEEFLTLPPKVIQTVLAKHQKYFVINDRNGKLSSNFIVITNGTEINNETVKNQIKKGNEKVVRARLNDAGFFYKEDLKTPFTFETQKNSLSKIAFQKKLGSMEEKVTRIIKLSEYIYKRLVAENTKLESSIDDIIQTAQLCKLDLNTNMVFEFTELQGEMGSIYANANGYNKNISEGIREHYYPRFYGDSTPKTESGLIVGIADKLDNITCLFSIGKLPTGSADPFALRRQAQGVIEHTLNRNWNLDLTNLIDVLITNFLNTTSIKDKISGGQDKSIKDFLLQRFITSMENINYESDLIDSVISIRDPLRDIISAKEKIHLLKESFVLRNKERYLPFLIAAKRLVRIVEKDANGGLDKNNLKTNEEQNLYKLFEDINKKIASEKYHSQKDLLDDFTNLTNPINQFFDNVLVNDPDPKIKQTRQSLLKKGKDLFEQICDFNKIVERT
ncbi:MAG: glycine--tRNA ligase subunit beta [Candidatus Melainabacteria bacterium]|nr:glycine--tRNA ligase subunit beta [Candidatus Melainabacteria bacterium]